MMRDAAFEDQGRLAAPNLEPRTAPLPHSKTRRPHQGCGSLSFPRARRVEPPHEKEHRMTRTAQRLDRSERFSRSHCRSRGRRVAARQPLGHTRRASPLPSPRRRAFPVRSPTTRVAPSRSRPSRSVSSRSRPPTPRSCSRSARATGSWASRATTTIPAEVADIAKVGDFAGPNLEAVAAAEPDLVVATTGVQADVITKLEELGATVVAVDPQTLERPLRGHHRDRAGNR